MDAKVFLISVLGMVVLWATSAVPLRAQEAERALVGVWVLNEDLSESPPAIAGRDRSDDQRGRGRGGGGGGVGGPGGGGGRGGFGGGFGGGRAGAGSTGGRNRPHPEEVAAMREAMQSAMQDLMSAPRRMTIVVSVDEIVLTYDDGRVVRLIPDEREHAGLAGNAMEVTRTTKWDGDQLVTQIELQSRTRLKVEQTYEVRLNRDQLVVTSRFEGDRFVDDEDREFRRVYEPELR